MRFIIIAITVLISTAFVADNPSVRIKKLIAKDIDYLVKFYKKIHRKLKGDPKKKEVLAKLRAIKKAFIKQYPSPSSVRVKKIDSLLSSLIKHKWTL